MLLLEPLQKTFETVPAGKRLRCAQPMLTPCSYVAKSPDSMLIIGNSVSASYDRSTGGLRRRRVNNNDRTVKDTSTIQSESIQAPVHLTPHLKTEVDDMESKQNVIGANISDNTNRPQKRSKQVYPRRWSSVESFPNQFVPPSLSEYILFTKLETNEQNMDYSSVASVCDNDVTTTCNSGSWRSSQCSFKSSECIRVTPKLATVSADKYCGNNQTQHNETRMRRRHSLCTNPSDSEISPDTDFSNTASTWVMTKAKTAKVNRGMVKFTQTRTEKSTIASEDQVVLTPRVIKIQDTTPLDESFPLIEWPSHTDERRTKQQQQQQQCRGLPRRRSAS